MRAIRNAAMTPVIALLTAFVLLDYLLYLVSGFDAFSLTVTGGLAIIVALAGGQGVIPKRYIRTVVAGAALVMGLMPGVIVFARGFAWAATPYDFALVGGLFVACLLGFGAIFLLRFQLDQQHQSVD
ncbi:MAG: hypothetical protein AAF624_09235 [Bacteroidota bacterium]